MKPEEILNQISEGIVNKEITRRFKKYNDWVEKYHEKGEKKYKKYGKNRHKKQFSPDKMISILCIFDITYFAKGAIANKRYSLKGNENCQIKE